MPYYAKVREYNDMESRDLWDYEVSLSEYEKDYFVAHLIEMKKSYFDYYYFSENCSYHILAFLAAIKPDLNLMNRVNGFVPPVDTIYALVRSGAVKLTKLRPSVNTLMLKRVDVLNRKQKLFFERLVREKSSLSHLDTEKFSDKEKVDIISAYTSYLDFSLGEGLSDPQHPDYAVNFKKKMSVNLQRSKIKIPSSHLSFEDMYADRPDMGHNTRRYSLGGVSVQGDDSRTNSGYYFQYRFSLHDAQDSPKGFIPFSTSELGVLGVILSNKGLKFDKFEVVNVEAIRPWSFLFKPSTWNFKLGIKDSWLTEKQEYDPYAQMSYGLTLKQGDFLFTSYFNLSAEYSHSMYGGTELFYGPRLRAIYYFKRVSLLLNYYHDIAINKSLGKKDRSDVNLKYNMSLNAGMNLKLEANEKDRRYLLSLQKNF